MKLEEYRRKAAEAEDWAPGWLAVDEVFDTLYPNQEPAHFATDLHKRAILGGDQYLDGYSIYQSPNGYKHILTYGMTELYANEEAFGGEYSRWGYEMTIKLYEESSEECMWAIDLLSNLARYTFTQKRYFEPFQYIGGNVTSIHIGEESAITGLLVVPDTEAGGVDSVHGRVDFLQLTGITQRELDVLIEDRSQAESLMERMKKDNPHLVTDMKRTQSYL
ncbi:suppressor of fused domain protein [Bacillus sp. FJAT-42376]|uniref:suppressor of fused domain protein n=1 Tax=Bacillus sp. FJAT-42376 TaxID=2014076 RepID=UPI000F4F9D15|nr:suppressor of fused domain protein [Bacillus sp. FJAT-42376]AZB41503.1 suppressor of fused domain protein [Bacillus sp. FJAT-42376]